MGEIIGDSVGFSTWAKLRTPIRLPGSGGGPIGPHTVEYVNGFAFHAGFKSTAGWLMRGVVPTSSPAVISFYVGSGGNHYFFSSFYTGPGGNTTNSIDESHALALIGQAVVLDGGTTFTITADYKDTLQGQYVLPPSPPNPPPSSFDIDQVGLLTAFDG